MKEERTEDYYNLVSGILNDYSIESIKQMDDITIDTLCRFKREVRQKTEASNLNSTILSLFNKLKEYVDVDDLELCDVYLKSPFGRTNVLNFFTNSRYGTSLFVKGYKINTKTINKMEYIIITDTLNSVSCVFCEFTKLREQALSFVFLFLQHYSEDNNLKIFKWVNKINPIFEKWH